MSRWHHNKWLMVVGALLGCSKPAPPAAVETAEPVVSVPSASATAAPSAGVPQGKATLVGTVRVPGDPPGEARLVLREGGEAHFRSDGPWAHFANTQVEVRAMVKGTDLDVVRLRLLESEEPVDPIEVRAVQTLSGRFEEHEHAPGTKLAGTKFLMFHGDDGEGYQLANHLDDMPTGKALKLKAREVMPSPFFAHVGGRFLWLLSIE